MGDGGERDRLRAGLRVGGKGRDERGGEREREGIKLRFNFAAISPARVARRDTPNIRRNLHFKLETSCGGGSRGLRCRRSIVVGIDVAAKSVFARLRDGICTKKHGPAQPGF